jgi:hypothetical protein
MKDPFTQRAKRAMYNKYCNCKQDCLRYVLLSCCKVLLKVFSRSREMISREVTRQKALGSQSSTDRMKRRKLDSSKMADTPKRSSSLPIPTGLHLLS